MSRARWLRIGLACCVAVGFFAALQWLPRQPSSLVDPQRMYRIERVLSADSLLLEDGRQVRLIGVASTGRFAGDARRFLEESLAERSVSFGYDRQSHDESGRRLVYAYRHGRLLNEEIIRAGYSRAVTDAAYHELMKTRFRQAERDAREQHRGLWSDAAGEAR